MHFNYLIQTLTILQLLFITDGAMGSCFTKFLQLVRQIRKTLQFYIVQCNKYKTTYAQGFCFSTNIMYKFSCKKSDLHYICTNKYSHHGTWKSTLDQNWSITKEGSYQKNSIVSNFSRSFVFEYLNVIGLFSNWSMLGHGPPFDHRPSTTKSTFAGRSDVVDVLLVLTSRP